MAKTVSEIVKEAQRDYDGRIILVKADGLLQEISDKVVEDEKIEFVTTQTSIGNETYRRSVVLLMLDAMKKIPEGEKVEKVGIEYSIGKGLYCKLYGDVRPTQEFLDKVKAKMKELVELDMPIKKRLMKTREAIELFKKHGMEDKTKLFKYRRGSYVNVYSLGTYEDYYYGYMAPSTGILKTFDLFEYDEGFVLQLPVKEKPDEVPQFNPPAKLFNVLKESTQWADMLDIHTVGALKRSTEEAEQLLEKSKSNLRMLKGVEEVCFIDSFVVDKEKFLDAYKISPESGKLFMYDTYFNDSGKEGGTVYETELGNKLYYSEMQPDSTLSILSRNKLLDKWSDGSLLPGSINEAMNADYPYVLTDGITIYYASDGPGSMGGYDIFVTRYNTNTDSYLMPENVGMPFNSPYNDYMYVIDEFNDLGWFASDRYQPEGKVCIYVFIPNSSKQVYNYEGMDPDKMISLAQLHSIKDTWTDTDAVEAAQERLRTAANAKPQTTKKHDFQFIIDDHSTYYQLDANCKNVSLMIMTCVIARSSSKNSFAPGIGSILAIVS